jgi:hypothetical protein
VRLISSVAVVVGASAPSAGAQPTVKAGSAQARATSSGVRRGESEEARMYRARLDSLMPQLGAAQMAFDRAKQAVLDSAAREGRATSRTRMLERGGLRIVADSSLAGMAARASEGAWALLRATFGQEADVLAAHPIVVQSQTQRFAERTSTTIRVRLLDGGTQSVAIDDDAGLQRAILHLASGRIHSRMDDSLRLWIRSPLPAGPAPREATEAMYVELVSASTPIARRCLANDVMGCRELLGLAPLIDPVRNGYTASERRTTVARATNLRTPTTAAEFDRCVADGDDEACIRRLRDVPEHEVARLSSNTNARRSYAQFALSTGGEGAYARLIANVGRSVDDRLAHASRLPSDSLIRAWRSHVLGAKPQRPMVTVGTTLVTLFWTAAFAAFSLRSSRWR